MSAISGSYLEQDPTYVIAQEPPIHRPIIRSIASQSLANMIPVLAGTLLQVILAVADTANAGLVGLWMYLISYQRSMGSEMGA